MKAFITAATAVAALAAPGAAFAATCADSNAVAARLTDRFGETLTYVGAAREDHEVHVYTSAKTGHWTLLVNTPTGLSCLLATGHGAESLADQLARPLTVAMR